MGIELNPRSEACAGRFANEKNSVLQEAKVFSKAPINVKKCIGALTRILHLLNLGREILSESEATEIFFGATRLFESNDERLRRLVYLLIKSLPVNDAEIFIVTSSLTKDINSPNLVYRANAIRALCCIVKGRMASQIERYLKCSLLDSDPYVSSSALLCCIRMFDHFPALLKCWIGETSACLSSPNAMVQFHGTLLMLLLKIRDRQSLRKLISTLCRNDLGIHVECFMIYFLSLNSNILEQECENILKSSLESHREATRLEAVKGIISLALAHLRYNGNMSGFQYDLGDLISVLQSFLSSKDQILVFAAMRQISLLSQHLPLVVSVLNPQVEELINHRSRDISSLALLTLLRTGGADTIECLLSQASSLSGEFRLDVVRAVKGLCVSFPEKHKAALRFYALGFREETSFEFKREMVDATIYIVDKIPEARTLGLKNICEFTEDCEFPELNAQMLKFLGENVCKTSSPEDYVRYIYNRLILEGASVRAAGIDALDRIVEECPSLRKSISVLLLPCLTDKNDEIRERANLIYTMMLDEVDILSATNSGYDIRNHSQLLASIDDARDIRDILIKSNEIANISGLCSCLELYIQDKSDFDMLIERLEQQCASDGNFQSEGGAFSGEMAISNEITSVERELFGEGDKQPAEQKLPIKVMELLPDNISLISTESKFLTEEEEDYNIEAKCYIFQNFMVLEFLIENTLSDQILENVCVAVDYSHCTNFGTWGIIGNLGIDQLLAEEKKSAYLCLARREVVDELKYLFLMGTVKVDLTFEAKSGGINSRGYREIYSANDLQIGISAHMVEWPLGPAEFDSYWDSLEEFESVGAFGLQFKTVNKAIAGLFKFFGVSGSVVSKEQPGNKTEKLETVNIAGKLVDEYNFVCKATIVQTDFQAGIQSDLQDSCLLKLRIRSKHPGLADLIFSQLE